MVQTTLCLPSILSSPRKRWPGEVAYFNHCHGGNIMSTCGPSLILVKKSPQEAWLTCMHNLCHVTLMLVNYRSEALPPVNYRSEALPPVNYRSDALPPARRTIILSVSAFSPALTHLLPPSSLPPSLPPSHLLYRYGLITQAQRAAINELYDFNPLVFDLACKRLARGPNGESFPPAVFKAHPKLPIQQPTASPSMTGPTNS